MLLAATLLMTCQADRPWLDAALEVERRLATQAIETAHGSA